MMQVKSLVGAGHRIMALALPFAVAHPLYTSVALLVIPECDLFFDSWFGLAVGIILYGSARLFAPNKEREFAARFPQDYAAYRKQVILPCL
jgi:protein-S-isoprenylcysteine O-methyltransferase Ste14